MTIPNVTVPAGNKTLLIVVVNNSNSLVPNSVTYNSQALTLLQTSSNSTSRVHILYRALGDLATAVTANVSITLNGAPANQTAFAYSLKNVDQTTPLSNPGTATFAGTATSSSASVAGAIGDMAIDFIYGAGNSAGAAPTFTVTGSG